MRVVVCCKAVPVDVTFGDVRVIDGELLCSSGDLYINEFDEYALETALALKKSHNVETWAVTVGPLLVQEVLYIALAKGIDNVLRIDSESQRPEVTAAKLMAALSELHPELVLTGVQSEDWMGSEVGIYLAQGLDMSLGFAVVEVIELNQAQVRVKKEIGGGRSIDTILKLPAVLCVQSGIKPLQYLSAIRRRKARNNVIQSWGRLEEAEIQHNIKGIMNYEANEVSMLETTGQAEIISGERPEKAKQILDIIKRNVNV